MVLCYISFGLNQYLARLRALPENIKFRKFYPNDEHLEARIRSYQDADVDDE